MGKNTNPGSIDGLKDSNMKSNRSSISVAFKQIQSLIDYTFKDIPLNSLNEKNLTSLKSNINSLLLELHNDIKNHYNLDYYIKSGIYLDMLIKDNQDTVSINKTTKIVCNYLSIAKLTKDSRIAKIALDLGELVHEIKKDPGIFV